VTSAARPLTGDEFARAMADIGGFEPKPALAVAVSGGADSMALALLAADWAGGIGGSVHALTVDHGLRPGSAEEAAGVRDRLGARGIGATVLHWQGPKPERGIQERARAARYRLLLGWCRRNRIRHLLVAHHAGDQAETVLMRLCRGSGVEGLGGMRPATAAGEIRILRPLLAVEPARLRATVARRGEKWIDDPSNADPRFARSRCRLASDGLRRSGLPAAHFLGLAALAATAREALDAAVDDLLDRCCRLDTTGFARVDGTMLAGAAGEIGWRALSRLLACVGGTIWPPDRASSMRLLAQIGQRSTAATLGRCRIVSDRGALLICREARHLPPAMPIAGAGSFLWDGRFAIEVGDEASATAPPLSLAPLGDRSGLGAPADHEPREMRIGPPPAVVRRTLPAVFDCRGVVAVPHLNHVRSDWDLAVRPLPKMTFRPLRPLFGSGYFLDVNI
jgi:tRNA(Ile)-lysidine synthase